MAIILQLGITILVLAALYSVVTAGFSLIYAVSGVLHVAQGTVALWGAYVFVLTVQAGWPVPLAAGAAIAASAVAGAVMNVLVFEPLRQRGRPSGVGGLIASVALLVLGTNTLLLAFGPASRSLGWLAESGGWTLGGATVAMVDVAVVVAATLALVAVGSWLRWSRSGMALRAVADHATVAEVVGIPAARMRTLAFGVGSALAGVGGILFAVRFALEPNQGVSVALRAFARAVVGGIGSVPGAVLGNLVLESAETLGAFVMTAAVRDVFGFAVTFAFLLVRPHGLLGRPRD